MAFILFVFISALALEILGTGVSVIGLAALFSGSIIVISLAICLDIAKVASVTFLYKYWAKVNFAMRTYMLLASIILMLITSVGVFGFLSGQFQKAISDNKGQNVILASLTEEQARLQKRKEEIDKQIAQLPENNVRGRSQLIRQFDPEVRRINSRLVEIDRELPNLRVQAIDKSVEIGPIIYVAEAFDTTPEKAVKWVILLIIFVFDPLAIALLLAGNFLLAQREQKNKAEEPNKDLIVPLATGSTAEIPKSELLPEPIKEVIPEPMKEVIPEPPPEPVKEVIPEPVKEVIPEPLPELLPEPLPAIDIEPTPKLVEEVVPTIIQTSQELDKIEEVTSSPEIFRSVLEDVKRESDVIPNEVENNRNISKILNQYKDTNPT